ncbi:MAG: hypothetical protein AB8C02_07270 [Halioglobus sp.]
MKPRLNFRRITADSRTADYIHRRFSFGFGRMQHALEDASITLSDINGPKGGLDKQCRIVVRSSTTAPIVVVEKQSELKLAIDRGIARASRSLARQLKRKQSNFRSNAERKKAWI